MPIVKEELWADADGNAVPFNDTRGRTVLFPAGKEISEGDAKKYGLTQDQDKPEPEQEPEQSDSEPETDTDDTDAKAVDGPVNDKAIQGSRNK